MTLSSIFPTDPEIMLVEVLVGGNGDIVLLQEVPDITGERYLRIVARPHHVEALISNISAVARTVCRP